MSRRVMTEVFCRDCGYDEYHDHNEYECPKCGSENVMNIGAIVCSCGEMVIADSHTNICPECGKMYNAFGQELAPVDQWDPEDAYDTFGPQEDW